MQTIMTNTNRVSTGSSLTLAQARSNFILRNTRLAASDFLRVATEAWENGRITAKSYRDIVLRVSRELVEIRT